MGIEGNERADELAKEALQGVGARLKALADRRRQEKQAKRGYRTLAYRHEYAEACTSDSSDDSDEEEGEGGRAGLGRTSSAQPALVGRAARGGHFNSTHTTRQAMSAVSLHGLAASQG